MRYRVIYNLIFLQLKNRVKLTPFHNYSHLIHPIHNLLKKKNISQISDFVKHLMKVIRKGCNII